jgi:hypothetical protein
LVRAYPSEEEKLTPKKCFWERREKVSRFLKNVYLT